MVFPQNPLLKSHSLTTWAPSLAGCNLSSAPHLVLFSGSLPPLDAFPQPLPGGLEAQGALPALEQTLPGNRYRSQPP